MTRQMDRVAEMMKYSAFEDRKEFGKRGYNFGLLKPAQIDEAYECWSHGWSIVEAYENVAAAKQNKITIETCDEDYDEWFNSLSAEEQQQEMLAYTE